MRALTIFAFSTILCFAATLSMRASVSQTPTSPVPAASAPTAPAAKDADEELFTRMCVGCHDATRVGENLRTKDEWEYTVNSMVDEGAEGTDAEFERVMTYLLRHFGRVEINKASAADIAAVLPLTPEQAQAVVAYRTANGPIKDMATLSQVPGLDATRLAPLAKAIAF